MPTSDGCGTVEFLWKKCDESRDCRNDGVCCYSPRKDDTQYSENVCREHTCDNPEQETCLVGGKCENGHRCVPATGDHAISEDPDSGYCL